MKASFRLASEKLFTPSHLKSCYSAATLLAPFTCPPGIFFGRPDRQAVAVLSVPRGVSRHYKSRALRRRCGSAMDKRLVAIVAFRAIASVFPLEARRGAPTAPTLWTCNLGP